MLEKHLSGYRFARAGVLAMAMCAFSIPAWSAGNQLALSEIKKEELPKAAEPAGSALLQPAMTAIINTTCVDLTGRPCS